MPVLTDFENCKERFAPNTRVIAGRAIAPEESKSLVELQVSVEEPAVSRG